MKITPVDIRQMTFRTRFRGYYPNEVDAFLEDLADEVSEALKENISLKERVEEQDRVIGELKKKESALTHSMIMAQKAIEDMKANAQKEGDLIVRQAEIRAEETTRLAGKQVAQLQAELLNLQRQRDLFIERVRSLMQSFDKTLLWESEREMANDHEKELEEA